MDEYAVSVIIPVYNYEKYLRTAIESLVAQSIFPEMEIIVVDDGSTDNSFDIANNYANIHRNIKVIHQENKGVSAARNAGIKIAKANYIGFVDADDWVDPNYYERMLSVAKTYHADFVTSNLVVETANGSLKLDSNPSKITKLDKDSAMCLFLQDKLDVHLMTKIILKELAQKNLLNESINIGEDRLFNLNCIFESNCIMAVPFHDYHYVLHSESAMKKTSSKTIDDQLYVAAETETFIQQNMPHLISYAKCYNINMKCRILNDLINYKNDQDELFRKLRNDILRFNIITAFTHNTKKHFMGVLISKINPYLYASLRKNDTLRYTKG